ncbi:hypothetical protein LOD99_6849 [Oopsacas minuta]|uniref:CUB domain-containing protein n=1 Tax=Oopsacas minuta TaxID=111878 RepID=A0AAV7JL96_9METZ|nr:hypothetical protein LOD99_6849 [Oopsacas minuta]
MLALFIVLLMVTGCQTQITPETFCQWKFQWGETDTPYQFPPRNVTCSFSFSDTLEFFNNDAVDHMIYRRTLAEYNNCNTINPDYTHESGDVYAPLNVSAGGSNMFTINSQSFGLTVPEEVYLISDDLTPGCCLRMAFQVGSSNDRECDINEQGGICSAVGMCNDSIPTSTPTATLASSATPFVTSPPSVITDSPVSSQDLNGGEIALIVIDVILIVLAISAGIVLVIVCVFIYIKMKQRDAGGETTPRRTTPRPGSQGVGIVAQRKQQLVKSTI